MGVQSLGWEDSLEKSLAAHPVLLPGESHGQRSLVGYSLQGHTELNMTEATWHACVSNVKVNMVLHLPIFFVTDTGPQDPPVGELSSELFTFFLP